MLVKMVLRVVEFFIMHSFEFFLCTTTDNIMQCMFLKIKFSYLCTWCSLFFCVCVFFYFSEKSLSWEIQYGRCVRGFWRQILVYILLASKKLQICQENSFRIKFECPFFLSFGFLCIFWLNIFIFSYFNKITIESNKPQRRKFFEFPNELELKDFVVCDFPSSFLISLLNKHALEVYLAKIARTKTSMVSPTKF